MGVNVNFGTVPDQQDFSLIPIGRYPARLHVEAYRKDQSGALMTGADDKPVMFTTSNGDFLWNLKWEILDGPQKGRNVLDNINFSTGGLKRVKVLAVRAGMDESFQGELEPDDLDMSCWWIEVEHPDPAGPNYSPKESKYTFKAKACTCSTCKKYDGSKVSVYAKVGFAGFELMKAADAARFAAGASTQNGTAGLCGKCNKGDHSHKQGAGDCRCENEVHPPF